MGTMGLENLFLLGAKEEGNSGGGFNRRGVYHFGSVFKKNGDRSDGRRGKGLFRERDPRKQPIRDEKREKTLCR
ncbi:hypothetical protein CULT_450005 [[Clostridium] ultunense Esp]|nr:hypothetical protein CULT_450005 [[Clostridium] ultunense Esp]